MTPARKPTPAPYRASGKEKRSVGRGAPERAANARLAEGEGQPDGHDEVGAHGCGSPGDRGEEQPRAAGLRDRHRQRECAGSREARQRAVAGVVRHPQEGARLPVVPIEPAAHQPEQDGGEERRVVAEQDHRAEEHRHLPGRGELVREDGDAVGEQRDGEHERAEDQGQLHRVAGRDQRRGRQHRGGFETDRDRSAGPSVRPPSTCRSASPETRFGRLDAIHTPAAPRFAPAVPLPVVQERTRGHGPNGGRRSKSPVVTRSRRDGETRPGAADAACITGPAASPTPPRRRGRRRRRTCANRSGGTAPCGRSPRRPRPPWTSQSANTGWRCIGFHAGRASMSSDSRCSRIRDGDAPNRSSSTVITVSQLVGSPLGRVGHEADALDVRRTPPGSAR